MKMQMPLIGRRRPGAAADVAAPPFPEGARMVFGIGAQKAGTTWLHSYLSRAPEMHFSPNKELHYFDVRAGHGALTLTNRIDVLHRLADRLDPASGHLDLGTVERINALTALMRIHAGAPGDPGDPSRHDAYLDYLTRGRTDQRLIGDITPAYAVLDRTQFADMASIGEARFVFVMRDPVARMWSQIRMAAVAQDGAGTSSEALSAACRARLDHLEGTGRLPRVERADYLRTMRELEAAVPAGRILYVFFEDLFEGGATRQICDFLGIAHIPPGEVPKANEGAHLDLPADVETRLRRAFARQYDGIRARFGDRVPACWRA